MSSKLSEAGNVASGICAEDMCDDPAFHWFRTSRTLLAAAEKKIFSCFKTTPKAMFVNIGSVVGEENNYIRTICFNEESTRLPIVLVHGFSSGVGLWCLNVHRLASVRPVYAFDVPGFGRSSRPQFSSNAREAESQFVQSIEEWRKQIGLERFVLVGHSMGGFLSCSYALQYPERVAHLILAEPWGFPKADGNGMDAMKIPYVFKFFAHINLRLSLDLLWPLRAAGRPVGPSLIKMFGHDLLSSYINHIDDADSVISKYVYHINARNPTGERAFRTMMANFQTAKNPMMERIGSLHRDVSITFIYGGSSWIDRRPGEQVKDIRKDAYVKVKCILDGRHNVHADGFDEFNETVLIECEIAERNCNT